MTNADTTLNVPATDFAATNRRVFIGDTLATARCTFVYVPSAEAQRWDGVTATHALGCRYGGYTYCDVKFTGRADLHPSGYGTVRKIRIEIGIGSECRPDDREWVNGWLIGGGDTLEAAA